MARHTHGRTLPFVSEKPHESETKKAPTLPQQKPRTNADEKVLIAPKVITMEDALKAYKERKGFCPLCGIRRKHGIAGHLYKCLRLANSKTESTTIT